MQAGEACTRAQKAQPVSPKAELNMMLSGDPDCALATLVNNDAWDPENWKVTMASEDKEHWEQGLTKELKSIEACQVWRLVPPSDVPKG